MKVLFINDSTSNCNWGDRAAAVSLRHMVLATGHTIHHAISEDDLLSSSFLTAAKDPPASRPGVAGGAVRPARPGRFTDYIPPAVVRFKKEYLRRHRTTQVNPHIPGTWEEFDEAARRIVGDESQYAGFLETLHAIDIAVIHGDGAMVGNGIAPRTDLFLSYLIRRYLDKPVIIVNHTADFDHPNLRRIAEMVYPLYDDVVFRDPQSAERCKGFCDGRFAADTAFLFAPAPRDEWVRVAARPTYFDVWPDTAEFDPERGYVCVGGSAKFGYYVEPYRKLVDNLVGLIEEIGKVYPGQIVLTVSDATDEPIFRRVAREASLPLVGARTPIQQTVDIVGNADAYIGGRWHPSIFALRGGTPIIPFASKTFKMEALAEMAGLAFPAAEPLELAQRGGDIARQLASFVEAGDALRDRLRTWAEEMCENSWDNVSYLRR